MAKMNMLPGIIAFTVFGTMTSARYIFPEQENTISLRSFPYFGITPFVDYPVYTGGRADWIPYRAYESSGPKTYDFPAYTSGRDIPFVSSFLPPPFSRTNHRQKRSVNPLPPGMTMPLSMNHPPFPLYSNMINYRHALPLFHRYDFDNLSSYSGKHGINPTSINPVPKGKYNFSPLVISPGVDTKVNMAPIASSPKASKNKLPAWYTQPASWMWPQGHKSGPLFGVKRPKKSVNEDPQQSSFMEAIN